MQVAWINDPGCRGAGNGACVVPNRQVKTTLVPLLSGVAQEGKVLE